jgi:hypothetical protein
MKFRLLNKWVNKIENAVSFCGKIALAPVGPARFFWQLGRACTDGDEENWASILLRFVSAILFLPAVVLTLITLPLGAALGISTIGVGLAGLPFAAGADCIVEGLTSVRASKQQSRPDQTTSLLADAIDTDYGSTSTTIQMAELYSRSSDQAKTQHSLLDSPPKRSRDNDDLDVDNAAGVFPPSVGIFGRLPAIRVGDSPESGRINYKL